MPQRSSYLAASLVIASALVALTWIAVASTPLAAAGSDPVAPTAVNDLPLDPNWLALVRAASPAQAGAPEAEGLTLNLNLTDQVVAGQAPMPSPVVVSLVRTG